MIGWKGFRMHEEAQCAPPHVIWTHENKFHMPLTAIIVGQGGSKQEH